MGTMYFVIMGLLLVGLIIAFFVLRKKQSEDD